MILVNGKRLGQELTFSGGEEHIKLPSISFNSQYGGITVDCRLDSSAEIMKMLLVSDAIKRHYQGVMYVTFNIDYLPYARQDRVCNIGEAYSLDVMMKIIGLLEADAIRFTDLHSDKAVDMLDNRCFHITSDFIFKHNKILLEGIDALVCPDKGAYTRVQAVASLFNLPVILCDKDRDTETGYIKSFNITDNVSKITGNRLLVIDDICDGGRTFEMLADSVLKFKPESLSLFVTHGIFSRGVKTLFKSGYNKIATTDSFYLGSYDNVGVIQL